MLNPHFTGPINQTFLNKSGSPLIASIIKSNVRPTKQIITQFINGSSKSSNYSKADMAHHRPGGNPLRNTPQAAMLCCIAYLPISAFLPVGWPRCGGGTQRANIRRVVVSCHPPIDSRRQSTRRTSSSSNESWPARNQVKWNRTPDRPFTCLWIQ